MHLAHALLTVVIAAHGYAMLSDEPETVFYERHCVVEVVNQTSDGELVLGPETCFASLGVALAFASDGEFTGKDLAHLSGSKLIDDPAAGAALSTFTLGIHFDGANGTGSSISVVGSSCTGGYWNTGGTWANRISSSWNGCYRLRHYDNPNKSGPSVDTTGVGQTDNLAVSMNNRTESVAYYGS
jgi:hypothetical protein